MSYTTSRSSFPAPANDNHAPRQTRYMLVTKGARGFETRNFRSLPEFQAHLQARGVEQCGVADRPSLRHEIRGQARYDSLVGPMWGGLDEAGDPIVRYEDSATNDILST